MVCDVTSTGAAGTSQSRVMLHIVSHLKPRWFLIPYRKFKIISLNMTTSWFQKVVQQHTSHDYETQNTVLYTRNSPLFRGVKDPIFVVDQNKFVSWVDANMMDAARLRKQKHECKHEVVWSGWTCGILCMFCVLVCPCVCVCLCVIRKVLFQLILFDVVPRDWRIDLFL